MIKTGNVMYNKLQNIINLYKNTKVSCLLLQLKPFHLSGMQYNNFYEYRILQQNFAPLSTFLTLGWLQGSRSADQQMNSEQALI